MRFAKTLRLSLLIALLSLGAIGEARAEACREETLPGSWRSMRSDNVWIFHADGKLGWTVPFAEHPVLVVSPLFAPPDGVIQSSLRGQIFER